MAKVKKVFNVEIVYEELRKNEFGCGKRMIKHILEKELPFAKVKVELVEEKMLEPTPPRKRSTFTQI